MKKTKTAAYDKDKVFLKLYEQLEDKDFNKSKNLSLVTPYIKKRSNIDPSTRYSFGTPFKAVQADITDTRFLAKLVVDPEYCLLFVDLFTSTVYVYHMKNKTLLAKNMEKFYNNIQNTHVGVKHSPQNRKLENFKKKCKRFEKMQKKKRIKPNQLIKNAAENMNNIISPKYGIAHEKAEQKSLDTNIGDYFKEVYDFVRLKKY